MTHNGKLPHYYRLSLSRSFVKSRVCLNMSQCEGRLAQTVPHAFADFDLCSFFLLAPDGAFNYQQNLNRSARMTCLQKRPLVL
jgi:hypothetical protein